MAQALRRPHLGRLSHPTLNTDGRRHPVENALTALTVLLGLISLGCALRESLHAVGSWVGLAGVLIGLYGQLRSATTAERFVLVVFLGAAALGFGLNMAHGGFL